MFNNFLTQLQLILKIWAILDLMLESVQAKKSSFELKSTKEDRQLLVLPSSTWQVGKCSNVRNSSNISPVRFRTITILIWTYSGSVFYVFPPRNYLMQREASTTKFGPMRSTRRQCLTQDWRTASWKRKKYSETSGIIQQSIMSRESTNKSYPLCSALLHHSSKRSGSKGGWTITASAPAITCYYEQPVYNQKRRQCPVRDEPTQTYCDE